MRRILSVIFVLTMVMGATGLFAAQADWKGLFTVQYQSMKFADKDGNNETYQTSVWQKLELNPSWKLSKNVAIHAGFFSQNFWGVDRSRNWGTTDPITNTNDAVTSKKQYLFDGSGVPSASTSSEFATNGFTGTPGSTDVYQTAFTSEFGKYNGTLGISHAYATLSFMDDKLTVDVGRRKNPMWGEGTYLGNNFNPDRIFVTYRMPFLEGMLLPIFIYERRVDVDKTTQNGGKQQIIPTVVYVKPGTTVAGITFDWTNYHQKADPAGAFVQYKTGDALNMYTVDFYIEHKMKFGDIKVTPTFDIVYSQGKAYDFADPLLVGWVSYESAWNVDSLSLLLKVKVEPIKMVSITPEFAFSKAPKSSSKSTERYWNLFTAGVGGAYTIGHIYTGNEGAWMITGGMDTTGYSDAVTTIAAGTAYKEVPSTFYAKLAVDFDLGEFVPGLSAYVWYIYAGVFGEAKTIAGTTVVDSDKSIGTEIDLGVSYKVDGTTSINLDLGYAKAGKNAMSSFSAGMGEGQAYYFGLDMTTRF